MRTTGRLVAVPVCLAVLTMALVFDVSTAAAEHGDRRYHGHDEAYVRDDDSISARATFVHDPGQYNLLSRQAVMANGGLYDQYGYGRNFRWYSYERFIPVSADISWSSRAGGEVLTGAGHTIGSTFNAGVDLHVFDFQGAFIARVCGNFRTNFPVPTPIPKIRGSKFHDLDRDGIRDPGESDLGGWTFRLVRESSVPGVDQPAGLVAETTSGADGIYQFDLDGIGPGLYYVEETAQDGWTRTTPQRRYVEVNFGIGDAVLSVEPFGNVENRTDLVKVDMSVQGMPDELMVGSASDVIVRSVIRNDGPAGPIDILEVLEVSVPVDCTATPTRREDELILGRGETRTIDVPVSLLCDRASFHDFNFENQLTIVTPGVDDTDPANNHRELVITRPVIAHTDFAVDEVGLDCPSRADKDETFSCLVSARIANEGPYGPADVTATLNLTVPSDCALLPGGPVEHTVTLDPGQDTLVSTRWDGTCHVRSFHPLEATAAVRPVDQHARDLDVDNDRRTTSRTVEIFEPADLALAAPRLLCDEYWTPDPFTCTFTARATNYGPASDVMVAVDIELADAAACSTTPSRSLTQDGRILDASEVVAITQTWSVTCSDPGRLHSFLVTARIRSDEPHAEDRNLVNNVVRVRTAPIDIKPNSDPNTLNMIRKGVTAVAILSTTEFDAVAQIAEGTIHFGPTGIEAPALRCDRAGEDANGDGLLDLVCHFDVQATGFTSSDQVGILTAMLIDGTPFTSADRVRILKG